MKHLHQFDEFVNEAKLTGKSPSGSKIRDDREEVYDDYKEWEEAMFKHHPWLKDKAKHERAWHEDTKSGNISVSRDLEVFGHWYNGKQYLKKEYGTVIFPYDPSDNIYPAGSRKD
jgi:hypothetical protein